MPGKSISIKALKISEHVWDRFPVFGMTAFLLLILATGCGEPDPRLRHLVSLHIKQTDLPPGWTVDGVGIDDRDWPDQGIFARWIQFRGVPESVFPTVLVSQLLVDYPDADQAIAAYAEEERKQFPVEDWAWPDQVQIQSKADEFRLACLERNLEIHDNVDERYRGSYFCTAVGRYGTTMSIIYANVFKDQWLTFTDLERLLEAADARLAGAKDLSQP